MFFVYVLRNKASGWHYTRFHVRLGSELGQHNNGITKSTKNRGGWEPIHEEIFATRAETVKREKFLKSGQGREQLTYILVNKRSGG